VKEEHGRSWRHRLLDSGSHINDRAQRPAQPARWSRWLGADPCDFAGRRLLECLEKLRNQGPEIGQTIRSRAQHDNRNRKARKVPLEREVTIDSHKSVELANLVANEVSREPAVNALIQENPHDAEATMRAFASSRKAITCSRLTVGKPSRKSSIVSPPSR